MSAKQHLPIKAVVVCCSYTPSQDTFDNCMSQKKLFSHKIFDSRRKGPWAIFLWNKSYQVGLSNQILIISSFIWKLDLDMQEQVYFFRNPTLSRNCTCVPNGPGSHGIRNLKILLVKCIWRTIGHLSVFTIGVQSWKMSQIWFPGAHEPKCESIHPSIHGRNICVKISKSWGKKFVEIQNS